MAKLAYLKAMVSRWCSGRLAATERHNGLTLDHYEADDCFLCSYPRSGNTWVRYLLANFRHPGMTSGMADFDRLVPDLHQLRRADLSKVERPRIFKTHLGPVGGYPRIVYLVRDPRDVACSYFTYRQSRGHDDGDIDRFVDDFVGGRIWPGRWDQHIESYEGVGAQTDITFFRYEDMKADTVETMLRIVGACGFEPDRNIARSVASHISLDDYKQEVIRRGYDRVVHGRAGRWKDVLTVAQADKIAGTFGPVMARWDYLRA